MKNGMNRIVCVFIVGLACFSLAGCGNANGSGGAIGIRGSVTAISGNSTEGNILVEGKVEEDTSFDKASVRVTKETGIRKGTSKTRLTLADIKLGDVVEVVMKGPVAESYPVQGLADSIVILRSAD
jgi:hypothetical protein